MKKTLVLFALLIAVSFALQSQTLTQIEASDLSSTNMFNPVSVNAILSWSPWTGIDSTTVIYSTPFDIPRFDSIDCWVRSTSVWGVPVFKAELLGGFDVSNFTTAVLGIVNDSTSAKTEVLTHYGKVATLGATKGKLKLTPYNLGAPTTDCNRSDVIINIYFVGHRRTQ
jgi:hypothetical protein